MELAEYFADKHILFSDELRFDDVKARNWSKKQCARILRKSYYRKMNEWTKTLYYKDFIKKNTPNLYVSHVDQMIGDGVFAKETIPALTYIGEYTGLVRRRSPGKDFQNPFIFRYVSSRFFTPYIIDAESEGNICRYINHSYDGNVVSRWMILDEVYHIIFFTKQTVPANSQLTYDYGKYYWKRKPQPLSL